MARILIQVRPGVETGHGKSPWLVHDAEAPDR